MIKNYKLAKKSLIESFEVVDFSYVVKPTKAEIAEISTIFDLPFDYIGSILDDDETARFEMDDKGNLLLLLQYPLQEKETIELYPFSLVVSRKKKAIILSLNHECDLTKIFEGNYPCDAYQQELIFQIINVMTQSFNRYLAIYKKRLKTIEEELKHSQENAQIMEIIHSQKSLIYFKAALEDNLVVYQKFMTYLKAQDEPVFSDRIFDIYVEANQALTTTEIHLKLLENLSDLFSNIVSNNLNIIMKIMTSATFIMTIPALIAGIYGMNVKLPIQQWAYAFWLIIVSMILISWFIFRIMQRKRMF